MQIYNYDCMKRSNVLYHQFLDFTGSEAILTFEMKHGWVSTYCRKLSHVIIRKCSRFQMKYVSLTGPIYNSLYKIESNVISTCADISSHNFIKRIISYQLALIIGHGTTNYMFVISNVPINSPPERYMLIHFTHISLYWLKRYFFSNNWSLCDLL